MPDDDTPPAPSPRPNGAGTGLDDPRFVTFDAAELRETLDLLGTLVASMSDRVDGQAATLDKLIKTAAETRAAAFHAKAQMDMKPVADAIAQTLEKTITPLSRELVRLKEETRADGRKVTANIDSLLYRTNAVIDARDRQIAGLQARSWIPLIALGAFVLVGTTMALGPWAVASVSGQFACWLMGGFWGPGSASCGL